MKLLRAAIIGCGEVGYRYSEHPECGRLGVCSHAEAYAKSRRVDLVGVCDADTGRAMDCAKKWGGRYYSNIEELLMHEQPEIVSICTPDSTHYEVALAVLESSIVRGVLMEKPIALEISEAERLIENYRRSGVILAVNYTRRYAENHQNLKKWIDGGGLGDLQAIHGFYTKGLLHNGTHWIDLLRYLGGDIEKVCLLESIGFEKSGRSIGVRFTLRSGIEAVLQAVDESYYTVFEMDLLGTRGRVRVIDSGLGMEFSRCHENAWFSGQHVLKPMPAPFSVEMKDAILSAVEDLVNALSYGTQPLCSGDDALEALRWATEAEKGRGKCRKME